MMAQSMRISARPLLVYTSLCHRSLCRPQVVTSVRNSLPLQAAFVQADG
jgi:hypothetical protein